MSRCGIGWLGVLGLALVGCTDPLFPDDAPHSQYERYSDLRGEGRSSQSTQAAGQSGSSLRERLAPLEEP